MPHGHGLFIVVEDGMGVKRSRATFERGDTPGQSRTAAIDPLADRLKADLPPDPLRFDDLAGVRSSELPPANKRARYAFGMHGRKKGEQGRLGALTGVSVSGNTHESEHPIGYEPLARGVEDKRGSSGRARNIENFTPAYQEIASHHRANIGTGTRSTADASGMNSQQYRDAQRNLLLAGDMSSPVQLNQLTYAHQGVFGSEGSGHDVQAADLSYTTMVDQMHRVTFADGENNAHVQITPFDRAEMLGARIIAKQASWLTEAQIDAIYAHSGIPGRITH